METISPEWGRWKGNLIFYYAGMNKEFFYNQYYPYKLQKNPIKINFSTFYNKNFTFFKKKLINFFVNLTTKIPES